MPTFVGNTGYSYGNAPYYRVETAEVEEGLLKFSVTARRAVKAYLKQIGAPMLENYAKNNHEWQNRTGTLESGITASVYEKGRANNNRLQQDYTCGVELYYTSLNSRGQRYGMYLEEGTKYISAYHTLRNAARDCGANVVEGMVNIVEKYGSSVFGVDDLVVDVNNDAESERY